MKLILLLVFIAFDLTSTIFLSQTEPSTRSNLNSPLRLIALTKSGTDYKKREFTSQTWYIKNVSARDVQLPLPKDRFQPKAKPVNFFLFRARVSGGWTSGGLADHEVNYKADCVKVPANKKHELFTTTFYNSSSRFKEGLNAQIT